MMNQEDRARAIQLADEWMRAGAVFLDTETTGLGPEAELRSELNECGIELHFVNRGKSSNTPEHRMTENIEGVFAEYWKDKIVEASKRGVYAKARSGLVVGGGKPPYGYRYKNGRLIINEKEAEVVRLIYHLYVTGNGMGPMTIYAICEHLISTGAPARAASGWQLSTVRCILDNTAYYGVMFFGRWHGKRPPELCVRIQVPPIIDHKTWKIAKARRARNKATASRNATRDYLLRGIIFCGCGRRMAGTYVRKSHCTYYRCPDCVHTPGRPRCHEPAIMASKIETIVWDFVTKTMADPKERAKEITKAREAEHEADHTKRERLTEITHKMSQCKSEAASLVATLSSLGNGIVSDTVLDQISKLDKQYNDLDQERMDIELALSAPDTIDGDLETLDETQRLIALGATSTTIAERKAVLDLMSVTVDVKQSVATVNVWFGDVCVKKDFRLR